ncbi:transposase, partial [Escherichia coli]|uniref:transposase n=1 Tax=Escherichia coli TaxID=562 RepID=UPI000B33B30A
MTKNTRFSPEVRQRAIRMVLESQGEYDSQWAAICSIAPKIGCTPETMRVWVRKHARDTGAGPRRHTLLHPHCSRAPA